MKTILDNSPIPALMEAAAQVLGSNHAVTRALATALRTGSVGAEMQARQAIAKLLKPSQDAMARLAVKMAS